MRTYTQLTNLAASLSTNVSLTNQTLLGQLINDRHRYLLQKYFDNERTVTLSTIGAQNLTLTTSLTAGATSATLTTPWTQTTYSQLVNFSDGEQRTVLFTLNSSSISWTVPLIGAVTSAIGTVGVSDYNIPANVSKIENNTVTVGQLKYQPAPVMTIQEWDNITLLPYASDIPNYFFIYGGQLRIFPVPSTTGNVITFNYKARVPDLTYTDYTTGTLAASGMTVGSVSVTGTGTSWTTYPQNVDLTSQNLYIQADVSTGGDGIWYQIARFTSATSLTLVLPVVSAPNITTSTKYTIGQLPLLQEDFHDMLVYGALIIYFTSIVDNKAKREGFEQQYDLRLDLLKDYAGTKSVNVDLQDTPNQVNPNLFLYANTSH